MAQTYLCHLIQPMIRKESLQNENMLTLYSTLRREKCNNVGFKSMASTRLIFVGRIGVGAFMKTGLVAHYDRRIDLRPGTNVLHNATCEGWVHHRRLRPVEHEFRYAVGMVLVDIDELNKLPWPGLPLSLKSTDLMNVDGDVRLAIGDCLSKAGLGPCDGRIFVLLQPRSWGYFFNPVVFYFCFDGRDLAAIVGEINNTPWNEKHRYVLDASSETGQTGEFNFPKTFHVSPFAPMEVEYCWQFTFRGNQIAIDMKLIKEEVELLRAGFSASIAPLTSVSMRQFSWRYTLQNALSMARIYYNALVLWFKRAPFYTHPKDTPT